MDALTARFPRSACARRAGSEEDRGRASRLGAGTSRSACARRAGSGAGSPRAGLGWALAPAAVQASKPFEARSRHVQQPEDARTAHEVAPCHASGGLYQTEGPLHPAALHPQRRAALVAGEKVDRRADAQRQAAGDAARLQLLCERPPAAAHPPPAGRNETGCGPR